MNGAIPPHYDEHAGVNHMPKEPAWHRGTLRKLFAEILPGDPELDALCCDYFPEVKRLFSTGMDRLTKETLLIERVDVSALVSALSHCSPELFCRWAHLVPGAESASDPSATGRAPMASVKQLSRTQLEDEYDHDVFLHSAQNSTDQRWRSRTLRPALHCRGLSVLDETDFHLGMPYIRAMEQAVQRSRYTVLILSPAFVEEGFAELGGLIAQHLTTEEQSYRVIGVIREHCTPRLGIRLGLPIDLSADTDLEQSLDRLANSLRQAPPASSRNAPVHLGGTSAGSASTSRRASSK